MLLLSHHRGEQSPPYMGLSVGEGGFLFCLSGAGLQYLFRFAIASGSRFSNLLALALRRWMRRVHFPRAL